MESRPHSGPAPLGEASVDGGPGRPEHRRQLPPGAARGGHENDRCQGLAVAGASSAPTLWPLHFRRRHHPPEQRPQLIRHQPRNQIRHERFKERSRHKKRRLSSGGFFCLADSRHGPRLGLLCGEDASFDCAVKPAGNSSFKLVNNATGRCLASSVKVNKPVKSMACPDDNPVRWTVGTTTRHGHSLKNTDSGWCLTGSPSREMKTCNARAVDTWTNNDRTYFDESRYRSQSEAGTHTR